MNKLCIDIPPAINVTLIDTAGNIYVSIGDKRAAIQLKSLDIIAFYLKSGFNPPFDRNISILIDMTGFIIHITLGHIFLMNKNMTGQAVFWAPANGSHHFKPIL